MYAFFFRFHRRPKFANKISKMFNDVRLVSSREQRAQSIKKTHNVTTNENQIKQKFGATTATTNRTNKRFSC